MATITLTGNYGYKAYTGSNIAAGTVIDATNASWIESNSANQNPDADTSYNEGSGQINTHPFIIYSAGQGLTIKGGAIWGEVPQTSDWQYTYNNSAAIRIDGAPGVVIEDWRIDKAWDGIRIRGNSDNFLIDDVHMSNVRDDAIENDFALSGTVRDSLFDGVFVGMALDNTAAQSGNTVTLEHVMMRSESFLYNGEMTHGGFFKTNTNAPETTPDIRIINSVFAIEDVTPIHASRLKLAWDNVVESHGNVFLNLSDTPLPSSYPKPPAGFTILQGQQARDYWEASKAAWIQNHDGVGDVALTPLPGAKPVTPPAAPEPTPTPTPGPTSGTVTVNDFNGDGRSDMLWRQTAGQLTEWLGQKNGSFVTNAGAVSTQVDNSWKIVASGDFNGDGRDDILWRHTLGEIAEWVGQSDGSLANNPGAVTAKVDSSWQVAGAGDFNGDGRDDILWRHSSGEMVEWLGQANGRFANNGAAPKVDSSWQASTGDFNGDGLDDMLWRHNSGEMVEWLGQANGSFANNGAAPKVDSNWKIAGTGDFNGDGRDDVLWRHASGEVAEWLGKANGSFASNGAAAKKIGTDWSISGIGDFNGDGRDDVFWHHTSGVTAEWLGQADGGFLNNAVTSQLPVNWLV